MKKTFGKIYLVLLCLLLIWPTEVFADELANLRIRKDKAYFRLTDDFDITSENYLLLLFADAEIEDDGVKAEFQDNTVWVCVDCKEYDAKTLREKYKNKNSSIENAPLVKAVKLFEEKEEEWQECVKLLKTSNKNAEYYTVTISEKEDEERKNGNLYIWMEEDQTILPLNLAEKLYGFSGELRGNTFKIFDEEGVFSGEPMLFVCREKNEKKIVLEPYEADVKKESEVETQGETEVETESGEKIETNLKETETVAEEDSEDQRETLDEKETGDSEGSWKEEKETEKPEKIQKNRETEAPGKLQKDIETEDTEEIQKESETEAFGKFQKDIETEDTEEIQKESETEAFGKLQKGIETEDTEKIQKESETEAFGKHQKDIETEDTEEIQKESETKALGKLEKDIETEDSKKGQKNRDTEKTTQTHLESAESTEEETKAETKVETKAETPEEIQETKETETLEDLQTDKENDKVEKSERESGAGVVFLMISVLILLAAIFMLVKRMQKTKKEKMAEEKGQDKKKMTSLGKEDDEITIEPVKKEPSMEKGSIIEGAVVNNKGRVRGNNEDNFFFNGLYIPRSEVDEGAFLAEQWQDAIQLYAVCDGMGGADSGEEASYRAVKELSLRKQEYPQMMNPKELTSVLRMISDEINREAAQRNQKSGTTIVMMLVKEGRALLANVGDSRIYRLRNGKLEQMSVDHSKVQRMISMGILTPEQAKTDPSRHVITQYLGMPSEIKVSPYILSEVELHKGDVYVLCSDGLTDMVEDDQMEAILKEKERPKEAVQELLKAALENGGRDNVTIMILRI